MQKLLKMQLLVGSLVALGAISSPAVAALFDDNEARREIIRIRDDYNVRLERLEAANKGQIELTNQLNGLRKEIAELRGLVETVKFQADGTEQRQKDFYIDLDKRLQKLETMAVDVQSSRAAPAADPGSATNDYENAINLLKGEQFAQAANAFERFIAAYPNNELAPNAYFWAANAQMKLRDASRAGNLFRSLATKWPNHPRAADALLGLANSLRAVGDSKGSKATLETLIKTYPNSDAAKTAASMI